MNGHQSKQSIGDRFDSKDNRRADEIEDIFEVIIAKYLLNLIV